MRLILPLGTMFVAALLLGAVSLQLFAPAQLVDESEPASRSAKVVAEALNSALLTSANPQQTLDAFVQALGTSEAIRFRRTGIETATPLPAEIRTPLGRVPHWFVDLLGLPEIGASFPVRIDGKQVGDILSSPDLSADIYEKWVGFLALVSSVIALMLVTGIIAYLTAGTVVDALRNLGEGLTRMRTGDYQHLIAATGPPEIRKSSELANELARTLNQLSQDNRSLLRKIVSLQDDERRDIARDLHDELGPLLFGIRANAVALQDGAAQDGKLGAAVEAMLESVEALQLANRRILDRLRPLHIQELGLEKSVQTLLQYARSQAPGLKLAVRIDPCLNDTDGLLSQTIYRVIQEGVTNVLRHANAGAISVEAMIEGNQVLVEISDDGVGFTPDQRFGRGLTGMHERVRALSGTFEFKRQNGRTYVRCRLPAGV
ncbi:MULTISPECIES: histidine kinase [unclassified Bradyrhizobium]|uniref:histidine kinase n=1 Tax=unclassified Bradyrhizobium TaxID=2631580 RepID=UPI00289A717A|nr:MULTISPECIES: histidine kinase [unclassified Bradyrhizobium]